MHDERTEALLLSLHPPAPPAELKRAILEEAARRMPRVRPSRGAAWIALAAAAALFAAIVVWLCLPTPEPAAPALGLDDWIEAFVKGSDTERALILKTGAPAILPLRRARDRAPDRVDDLLFDLKRAVAAPEDALLAGKLGPGMTVDLTDRFDPAAPIFGLFFDLFSRDLPLLLDPATLSTAPNKPVSPKSTVGPRRAVLDDVCRQAGLDYGFFFGRILVSEPERLWPAGPFPDPRPLTPDETGRVKDWIENLQSDRIADREAATDSLKRFGRPAVPLLRLGAGGKEAEPAARCRDLLVLLDPPPRQGLFGPPGADRQKLSGADADVRKTLLEKPMSVKISQMSLDNSFKLLFKQFGMVHSCGPRAAAILITIDAQDTSSWAIISVLTQAYGCDFMILDGKIHVDTREEIRLRLAQGVKAGSR